MKLTDAILDDAIERLQNGEEFTVNLAPITQLVWSASRAHHKSPDINTGTHQWITSNAFRILRNEQQEAWKWFYPNDQITVIKYSDWPDYSGSGERYPFIKIGNHKIWLNNWHYYHVETGTNFMREPKNFNAVTRFEYWYNQSLAQYRAGHREEALCDLGKAIHYLADLGSPPHTGDRIPAEWNFDHPPRESVIELLAQARDHVRYELFANQVKNLAVAEGGGHFDWTTSELQQIGKEAAQYSHKYYSTTRMPPLFRLASLEGALAIPQYAEAIINPLMAAQRNVAGILYKFYRDVTALAPNIK
ncbi:MAG: hypothetical protein FWF80_08585 [Defluviitaleaceae bacterium]|nr:hypothetical protein [Defluviitaleaceae bacterium]